jgi:hypothetical protein
VPYKDPERKKEAMRQWRQEVMPKGYGKWLYARRRLRFEDAERFKDAAEEAVGKLIVVLSSDNMDDMFDSAEEALAVLQTALRESMEAEQALGDFDFKEDPQ